ncbi:MAG: hypothetical protein P8L77_03600 [Gammaproteobacteria bacterium]|nr:hypothetical protein [Gammaproteobacteria bacterium]
MANDNNNKPFFTKGRRGADSLKIAYIIFALLLAIMTFATPATLPLWFTLITIVGTGPIWNIIDGFVDDDEQWLSYQANVWNENKFHTYFNWACLGFLSTFALGLCIVAAMTQLTALTAGTAVVMGVPISLLIGPIGGAAFAITMLWLAKKSFNEIKTFDKLISVADEPNKNELKQQRGHVVVDFCAWLSAGLGATGFALLACLAFASIGFPPALPIIFTGIVLLSASIKIYQLAYHPKTPTADSLSLRKPTSANVSSSFLTRQSSSNQAKIMQDKKTDTTETTKEPNRRQPNKTT